jgi:hypothetical protein
MEAGRFENIPSVTERVIRILAEVEHVHVCGGPTPSFERAKNALQRMGRKVQAVR